MVESLKDSEAFQNSIVRLFTVQDVIVGAGFLVGKKYVVTCAHVVNQVLERENESVEKPVDEKIYLNFRHSVSQRKYTAHVVCWHPLQPSLSLSVSDVAILELDEIAPDGAIETQFALPATGERLEHKILTYGFPVGYDQSESATGIVRAKELNGLLQLEPYTSNSTPIRRGFSGSPVWDEHDHGVIGMIVEVASEKVGVAFAIPTEKLIEAWSTLDEYVNNNFALITEELKGYLNHLSEQLALLPGYYPPGFSFDRIRQRIRMNQRYDPAYEEAGRETMQAHSIMGKQEDSSTESEQVYKKSSDEIHQSNVVSLEVVRAEGTKISKARSIGAEDTAVTESIIIDWEMLRTVAERVVILGDPGSGKSWLLKYEGRTVAREQLDKLEHGQLHPSEVLFPIFLRLGTLAEEITGGSRNVLELVVQLLKRQYVPSASERFLDSIRRWLAGRQCLLLLDALDEVTEDRRKKINNLLRQIGEESDCRILLTSRSVGYSSVPFVHKGGKWKQELEIVAFAQEQIEGFIHSWFGDRENDSQRLLTVLQTEKSLHSLAIIPLLLSFLCLATAESQTIPTQRAALYERVLRLLLEASWRKDVNDAPEVLFDARLEAKLVLLESLAWHFATLNGRWHDLMVTQELEEVVRKRSQDQDLVKMFPSYEQLMRELTEKDALLIKVGSSQRSRQKGKLPHLFLHRTIHEYLTARYLASLPIDQCLELVRSHFWFDSNREVIILLLAGCLEDPNPLLNEFLHESYDAFHTLLFLAGRCLVETGQLVVKQEIRDKITNGLFDLLSSSSKYNQAMAIQVIGTIGEPVLDKVITLVQSKRDGIPLYPRFIREAAMRVLGQINHPRVLPELLTVFTLQDGRAKQESDIELWTETAFALGRMNDPRAVQVLIDALNPEQPRLMRSAAQSAIRQMDYSQAVYVLYNALKSEKYIVRRNALIRALTNIGNAEAVNALLNILRSNYRAYEVLLSLRQFVARYLSILGDAEQRHFWSEALKTGEPMMTLALSHRDDAAVKDLPVAVQGIDNGREDLGQRWDEAWNVAQPDEEVLHAFIKALWDAPEYYRNLFSIQEIASWLLGQIRDGEERKASVAKIRAFSVQDSDAYWQAVLTDSHVYSRKLCGAGLLTALQLITESERRQYWYYVGIWMLPKLLDKLSNARYDEQFARSLVLQISAALKEIGDRRSVKALRHLLNFEYKQPWDNGFRGRLISTAGAIGDPQAIADLLKMFSDCFQVLQTISHNEEQQIADIKVLLKDVIGTLGISGSLQVVQVFIASLKGNMISGFKDDHLVKSWVVDALGELGDTQAVDILLTMLYDEDRFVRLSVAQALGKLDSVRAVDLLLSNLRMSYWRKILSYSVEFLRQEEATEKSPLVVGFLMYSEFREVTGYALKCIGKAEKPLVVRALLEAAKTGNRSIRRVVKGSIGRLSRPQDVALALETLLDKTEDLAMREKAAALLARIGDERVVDSLLVCLQEEKLISTIETSLEQMGANCDECIFCEKLLRADVELALNLNVRVFIYDLLAQHRSQLREAVGENWVDWQKKLFRLTAYRRSVIKLHYRAGQWSIHALEMVTSWKTYKSQLYSAYRLYKEHISSTYSQTQPSPKYKANIFGMIMALLGVRENTAETIMTTLGMEEKTAGWLSYYGGWLTGIIFFLLWWRNPFVRLHAIQSIIVFGSINILEAVCSSFSSLSIANHVLDLTAFICWVVFMSLAREGKDFKLPIIGNWVSRFAKRK